MRKRKLPDEIAALAPTQLLELDSWLDRHPYQRIQKMFSERFGVSITVSKLHRYYQHLQTARLYSASIAAPVSPTTAVAIRNADPAPSGDPLQPFNIRCLQFVSSAKNPGELKELLDICTYKERHEIAQGRLQLSQRAAAHRSRVQQFREATLAKAAAKHCEAEPFMDPRSPSCPPQQQQKVRGE